MLRKLPSVLSVSALKAAISLYLDTVWKKANLYGSDLSEAFLEVACIFASNPENGPASDFITCLV